LFDVPAVADAQLVQGFWAAFDRDKHSLNDLMYHMFDMVAFADAWTAIELRWVADDYSVRSQRPLAPLPVRSLSPRPPAS
jgi:hypothetical protein